MRKAAVLGLCGAGLLLVALDINLALERGEVEGRCGWTWSSLKTVRPQWIEEGFINILVQSGFAKHPEIAKMFPEVPLDLDLI